LEIFIAFSGSIFKIPGISRTSHNKTLLSKFPLSVNDVTEDENLVFQNECFSLNFPASKLSNFFGNRVENETTGLK
jgi:hypothetical protein